MSAASPSDLPPHPEPLSHPPGGEGHRLPIRTEPLTRYRLDGIVIDALTRRRLVALLAGAVAAERSRTAAYLNAHGFLQATQDPRLRTLLEGFDLVFCDGVGLRWGLRLLGVRLPERMTPPDFIDDLIAAVAAGGGRVYLLGDEPGVAERAAERYEEVAAGAVAGAHHGFFPPEREDEVARRIADSGARLVLVGMGTPRQEELIARLAERLPGRSWLAVGGLFRWHAGIERRGPRWLTDHGGEWTWRLAVQPRRVARRYLLGLPRFAARIATLRLRGGRASASQTVHPLGSEVSDEG